MLYSIEATRQEPNNGFFYMLGKRVGNWETTESGAIIANFVAIDVVRTYCDMDSFEKSLHFMSSVLSQRNNRN